MKSNEHFTNFFNPRNGTYIIGHIQRSYLIFTALTLEDPAALREICSVPRSAGGTPLALALSTADLVLMPVNTNDDPEAAGGGSPSIMQRALVAADCSFAHCCASADGGGRRDAPGAGCHPRVAS